MNEGSLPLPRLPTLLIVDDQLSVCIALEFALMRAGYRVLLADSGVMAQAVAATRSIDGALIDVHMPGLNGFDTCARLQKRAAERQQPLRIWFMTGAATADLEAKGATLGALGVVRKPFDFPALLATLESGFSAPLPNPSASVRSVPAP